MFFSRISLEDVPGTQYEPYIFAALNSAKVMVVVGTSAENLNAVWVKNEWSRFLAMMRKDRSKLLIPCYRDMDPYDLPEQLSVLMSYDMSRIGFIQDLIRGVDKVLSAEKKEETVRETVKETVVVQQSGDSAARITAAMDRGFMALEDGEWDKAVSFFDQALSLDAKNARAYYGMALAKAQCRDADVYINMLCSGMPRAENIELPRDEKHIREAAEKYAVLGYLNAEEIRALYDYTPSYHSTLQSQKQLSAQAKKKYESDRNFTRARQFAAGEFKTELEDMRKKLFERLDKAVRNAEESSEKAKQQAEKTYKSFLTNKDRLAEEKCREAEAKREADYQDAMRRFEHAKSIENYQNTKPLFIGLTPYKDSAEMAKRCDVEAARLKWVVAEVAERKRKAEAEEAERQVEQKRIAIEKEAKKRKKTIAIAASIVIACIAFVIVMTTVIIPKQKYNAIVAKYGQEYINSFYALNVGDTFIFGSYEQDNNITNGKENLEWLVLSKDGDKVLLISKYALDCQQYYSFYQSVTWENCSLRKWLNGTFLRTAFSKEERAMIPSVTVSEDENPNYTTILGNNKTDQVFLLSIKEANKYFSSDEERKCAPTDYAIAQDVWTSDSIKVDGKATCWWWLRSTGLNFHDAAGVNAAGSVDDKGFAVNHSVCAVRPAVWLNLGT